MPSKLEPHSHRSTTKVVHKPFKSRKATKGFLKEIKKGKMDDLSHRKTPHQLVMSKLDRRNHNKQKQLAKHREHLKEASIFSGRNGVPRIVAIIPLSSNVSAAAAARSLSQSLDITCEVPEEGQIQIDIDRFKQKVQFVLVAAELMACLDAGRVADFVIFILSAEQEVNEEGENIIRSVESQGISTLLTTVQGLDNIEPPKKRVGVLSSLKSFIKHFHPEQEKVHNLNSRQECANLMRSICTTSPKGVRWRDERSWMLVDEVKWPATPQESVALTGTIRGKGLKADRLIQVGEWGDYQIEKIVAAPLNSSGKRSSDSTDASTAEIILEIPGDDQDDLAELALEETIMQDVTENSGSFETTQKRGVLLDDHHYFSDEEKHNLTVPKRLPKGTSAYQAAWYLGDEISDSDSDIDETDEQDTEMEITPLPQDGTEGLARPEPTEIDPTTYAQSEIFLDPNLDDEHEAEQLAAFRRRHHDEAEDDREFPDEIELHPQVLARERLARYRGLKSLRSSPWEESEDRAHEPEEWKRLLQVPNYKSARSRATREALVGGVAPGTRVHIYLKNVPLSLKTLYDSSRPLNLFSLLRHEHKRAVLNFNINLSSDYPEPIKSKTELVLQCGPRRFVINPLFSQGGHTSNDVHKFDRYLHPGTSAVATFIAPLIWGSVPTLVFKRTNQPQEITDKSKNSIIPLTLIATGTSLPPSSTRVIAKRVILTGHPYKIHKKLVTIRYMFFNREDVEWFKALQLWTKRGRSGYIKESLGTHGYFKATFDAKINPQDSVGVSLYKRVWPRSSRTWNDLQEEIIANEVDDIIMGS
ncbi:BgTH12-00541 [Blumeria graminis f. sp. triticale]|uniref:BgTH12-00541 n=1 Tax=Blumeria graminis f. sp. triticale TaxID=1689686 RepID=A0A9W4GGX8_BLUGR|nr:BgTH12-00541 [Blumeria graminis f. sp. triticale]